MGAIRKITLAVVVAALSLTAACSGDGSDGSKATSTTAAENDAGGAEAGESNGGASAGQGAVIPAKVGNRWVYRNTYPGGRGTVTNTQEVTSVDRSGDDRIVTINNSFHYDDGSQPDFDIDLRYTFHPDGSISVPPNAYSVGDSQVENEGTGGASVWPSHAELESGAPPRTSSATGTVNMASIGRVEATYNTTASGAGTEDVSVPAGSFPGAVVMNLQIDISVTSSPVGALNLPVTQRMYFARGVGMVKQDVGGDFMPGTTQELVETNVKP